MNTAVDQDGPETGVTDKRELLKNMNKKHNIVNI